jgi:hypothetical protein
MERVHVQEELDAPVGAVWRLIRDFGDISAWAAGYRLVRVDGAGVGMIRHIDGTAGRFVERLETHDDGAHTFSYRLLESPLPATNFVGSVRLTPSGPARCLIEWAAEFDASAPTLRDRIENGYRNVFIGTIRRTLTGERGVPKAV